MDGMVSIYSREDKTVMGQSIAILSGLAGLGQEKQDEGDSSCGDCESQITALPSLPGRATCDTRPSRCRTMSRDVACADAVARKVAVVVVPVSPAMIRHCFQGQACRRASQHKLADSLLAIPVIPLSLRCEGTHALPTNGSPERRPGNTADSV